MRARKDRCALEAGLQGKEAKQLGFLAAHHVLAAGFALADAGENPHVEFGIGFRRRDGAGPQAAEVGGRIEIGSFDPSLARAGHAADDDFAGELVAD